MPGGALNAPPFPFAEEMAMARSAEIGSRRSRKFEAAPCAPIVKRHKDFMRFLPLSCGNDDYVFAPAERMPASPRIARSPIDGYEDYL